MKQTSRSFVLTAANGDTVTATFVGSSAPTEDPVVFAVFETVTITGGTGRFVGAEGHFVMERLVDLVAGTTTGSFNGTISRPHR